MSAGPSPVLHAQLGTFTWHDYTLSYEIRGTGDKPVVLVHGLLTPSWINGEIARRLAERGYKVILFDLLGHGRSDKPLHASAHRLEYAGQQVVALLDHLGIDRAVVGGMSLGANVALEVAARAPERVEALICEMPVLERGAPGVMLTLLPLLVLVRYGGRAWSALVKIAERVPRGSHEALNAILDTGGDARAMAAVLHGYASGPTCPPSDERKAITAPALIIGHSRDWMHPFNDAHALSAELPDTTFLTASSIFELRARPDRLTAEIIAFLERLWPQRQAGRTSQKTKPSRSTVSPIAT